MPKNKISKTFFFLLFLLYQNILNFCIYFKSKHFYNSIHKENTLIRLQWEGHSPSPFWCLCQKPLCPFAYFNKTLLHTHTHTHTHTRTCTENTHLLQPYSHDIMYHTIQKIKSIRTGLYNQAKLDNLLEVILISPQNPVISISILRHIFIFSSGLLHSKHLPSSDRPHSSMVQIIL